MKCGYIFSIFGLLLIALPLSNAIVKCPYGNIDEIESGGNVGEKTCPIACAAYTCNGTAHHLHRITVVDVGCVEDFFRDCASFEDEIERINATANLYDTQHSFVNVTYVSGCGNEKGDVKKCILDKYHRFQKQHPGMDETISSDGQFPDSITDIPALLSGAPEVVTRAPALISTAPDVFTEIPAMLSNAPALLSDAPALISDAPEVVTDVPAPSKPIVELTIAPSKPITSTDAPDSSKPITSSDTPDSSEPIAIITIVPPTTNSSSKPTTTRATTTHVPKRTPSTKTPPGSKRTTPIINPDPLLDDPKTTVADDLLGDATPTPAVAADSSTSKASKGQEGGIWKKIGCFFIGTIIAAWMY